MLSRFWFFLMSSFLLFTPLLSTLCNSSLWGDSLISFSMSSSSLNSLIPLSFWLGGIMMMMSHNSVMTSNPVKKPFLFMLCILTLTLVVSVFFTLSGLISFYFLFELSLIPTFILIMVWGYQPERLQASMYMLMYTVAASLPLLLTLGYLFSTNYSLLFYFVSSKFESVMLTNLKPMLYISLMAAFMVKLPVYGVHIWLPKAHVEAPVSGSMALAGVLLKLGGAGIYRMNGITGVMKPFPMMLSITLLGGLISSIACLLQTDFKALIAYSSVGHMSMVFAGLLGSGVWGLKGSIINMVAHGFVSPGMFALANVFYKACSTRSMQVCKGLLSLSPAVTTWTAIFCFANMSNPPTINLLSEMLIFPALASYSFFLLLIGGGLCFLAMAFSMHLYMNTQHGSGNPVLNPANIGFSHMAFLALAAPVYFLVIGIFI